MKKAFIAVLLIAAVAAVVGASAASSASKKQDLLVGYDHTPTAADKAAVANAGGTVKHDFSSINVLAVSLPSGKAADLRSQAGVSYVEPDAIRTPLSLSGSLPTSQLVPTPDNGLYGLLLTHANQTGSYKGQNVTACVADTGLDTHHPDIAPNLIGGYDVFSHTEGKDAIDVFKLGHADTETHATHVTGIVAGADNGLGIVGVAPQAKVLEARVLGTQPDGSVSGETSQVMEGVAWLAAHGCKVINMSLGGGDRSQAEEALYNDVIQHGTTIVVATGNDSASQLSFPGRYQNVISVGAVDRNKQLASFSNTGAQIDLVAPGVDNLSSFPAGQGRDSFVTVNGATYAGNPADPAGATPVAGITGPLVNCGLAQTAADCGTNPPAGFVALISRGKYSFTQKVQSAMAAHASAVILYNNTAGSLNPGLYDPTGSFILPDNNGTPWIPVVALTQADGQAILAANAAQASVFNVAMAWNNDSGTSMATPHVTGVVALLLSKNPNLNPHEIEMILDKTATDLGVPNYDTTYGYGIVNAQAALAATPAP